MIKHADIEYPILDLLETRWSPRQFSDRKVSAGTLGTLFEACRWAPSSYNEQPWHFIVTIKENRENYMRLLSCLTDGNLKWAQNAPVLMLSVAKLKFSKNDKVNRHAFHDVGLAAENLIVQATSMNLYVHQMAGFDVERARELFAIPKDYEPVSVIAIGYLSEEADVDRLSQRTRKPFKEFVFAEQFGKPAKLFSKNGK